MTDLVALFFIGLAGSAHCIGMCGAFAVLAGIDSTNRFRAGRMAFYALGKTTTYAFLGFGAGLIGQTFRVLPALQLVFALVLGVFLILVGLGVAGIIRDPISAVGGGWFGRLLARRPQGSATGPFALGLVNGLLPCGLVVAALAASATAASIPMAMAMMTAFGIATLPALVITAIAGARLAPAVYARISRFSGWIVVAFGVATIVRALIGAAGHGGHMG